MAIVHSYGAAEVVTGSCHLLQIEKGPNIMVDCGMFQGVVEKRNFEPFDFDPADVDILLITHAHLDHVGRIPKLVKEGFSGRIDSAHLMDEEYRTDSKRRRGAARKRV